MVTGASMPSKLTPCSDLRHQQAQTGGAAESQPFWYVGMMPRHPSLQPLARARAAAALELDD